MGVAILPIGTMNPSTPLTIYKLIEQDAWQESLANNEFQGSPADRGDGYIHFSTIKQLPTTLERHFRGQSNLVLLAVDAELLDDLHWEVSSNGQVYPHLYGEFPLTAVTKVVELPVNEKGYSCLPAELAEQAG